MSEDAVIEWAPGIRVCPLRTETLPPATHTNVYLLGTGELLIVDPGAEDPEEQSRLISEVRALEAKGQKPRAVFLTHHHPDHTSGAQAVAQALSIGVWCHPLTAARLDFPVERIWEDGEEILLAGSPPMRFRLLHTPGHAQGHLSLWEESSGAAIVGDMVAGIGTILIDPPEGDMAEYLRQLRRLKDLPVGALYPAHGPPLSDGPAALEFYLAHRLTREEKVWEALPPSGEGDSLERISAQAYSDSPQANPWVAQRSTLAHLIKLQSDGRAHEGTTGAWSRR